MSVPELELELELEVELSEELEPELGVETEFDSASDSADEDESDTGDWQERVVAKSRSESVMTEAFPFGRN